MLFRVMVSEAGRSLTSWPLIVRPLHQKWMFRSIVSIVGTGRLVEPDVDRELYIWAIFFLCC